MLEKLQRSGVGTAAVFQHHGGPIEAPPETPQTSERYGYRGLRDPH